MDIKKLESYAELIVRVGANVQKGQDVVISAELDQPEFVEMLVEQCYLAGAAEVRVEWTHQPLRLKHVKYQTVERLGEIKDWEKQKLLNRAETLPAMIYIESADPSGLDGLDQEKWGKSVQMRWKVIKPIRDSMENKYQWVIAAAPGKAWAKKVFPELGEARGSRKALGGDTVHLARRGRRSEGMAGAQCRSQEPLRVSQLARPAQAAL